MNKIRFYFLAIIILFLIIEFFSYLSLKRIVNTSFKKYHKEIASYDLKFKKKKSYNFVPYINHKKNLIYLSNKPNLYYQDESFLNIEDYRNKNLVLFQGDSWGQIARDNKKILKLLNNFELQNDIKILNTSTSSFSLSTMLVQLKILQAYQNIYPEIIVMMLDQSDLGDDLYRRENYYNLPTQNKIELSKNIKIILEKKNLSFIKIMKLTSNFYFYYKKTYNFSHLENIFFLGKKLRAKITKSHIQLDPLIYGIKNEEENFFYKLLSIYNNLAFENDNLKKIIIVTHPHKKNVLNIYKLNLSLLIDEFLNKNKLNDKIFHLNFSKKINEKKIKNIENFFVKGDRFSHLTDEKYLTWYFPYILEELDKLLAETKN